MNITTEPKTPILPKRPSLNEINIPIKKTERALSIK